MSSRFPWGHERRYRAASNASREVFGERVQKLSVNAGFTCPNRDGTVGRGGCSYCTNEGFSPAYCHSGASISEQVERGIAFHSRRYRRAGSYLAYFQTYSNTYANVGILRERYFEALSVEKVIGIIIGTRPDCLEEPVLDLLEEINQKSHLVVELGIESVYNKTLERINRGHSFEQTQQAFQALSERGIKTGGHMIIGLPGETEQMLLNSATILSQLPLHSIKFHQLQIMEGTAMAQDFVQHPSDYKLFTIDEYVDFMARYLTLLTPEIIIERLAGETHPERNLGIHWGVRYHQVVQRIEDELQKRNWYQGMNFKP